MFVDHNGTLCYAAGNVLTPITHAPRVYSVENDNMIYYEDGEIKIRNEFGTHTLFSIDRTDLLKMTHQSQYQYVILVFHDEIRVYKQNHLRYSIPVMVDHTVDIDILISLNQSIAFGYIHAGIWTVVRDDTVLDRYELPHYTNYISMRYTRDCVGDITNYTLRLMNNDTLLVFNKSVNTGRVHCTQYQLDLKYTYDDVQVYYDQRESSCVCRSITTSFGLSTRLCGITSIDINGQYALIKGPGYVAMRSRNIYVAINHNPDSINLTNFTGVIVPRTPVKSSRKI